MRVVAAAIVHDARVLAGRRVRPTVGWEFPGGKVERAETPEHAVERECREELGVAVRALAPLATAADKHIELSLWHVTLLRGAPRAQHDHDELRWLDADELGDLDWLPIDRELLAVVRPLLRSCRLC
jgi:8-oxo-dGTP diphosphatase